MNFLFDNTILNYKINKIINIKKLRIMIYNRIEKKEITNNVINKFMNEWEGDMWSRYEMNVEYKLNNGKIIEIGTYDNED